MPIYEYQCDYCNHSLEVIQKVNDPPPTVCPSCEMSELRKKVSAVAFRLSGGGWYETDFKTGDKKNLVADTEKKADGASEKKVTDESASKEKSSASEAKKDKDPDKNKKGDSASSSS